MQKHLVSYNKSEVYVYAIDSQHASNLAGVPVGQGYCVSLVTKGGMWDGLNIPVINADKALYLGR
jgi:hypothetical protein